MDSGGVPHGTQLEMNLNHAVFQRRITLNFGFTRSSQHSCSFFLWGTS